MSALGERLETPPEVDFERATVGADSPNLEPSVEDLYGHLPCGHLSTTADGVLVKVNKTFLAWTGYTRDQLIGVTFSSVLDPGSKLFYETRYLPALRRQGEIREVAMTMFRSDGTLLPILINSTFREGAVGQPEVIRTAVFDITGRHTFERHLQSARRAAELSEARMRILHGAATAFGDAVSEESVTAALVDIACKALDARSASVLLVDEPSGALCPVAGTGHRAGNAIPLTSRCPEVAALEEEDVVTVSSLDDAERDFPEVVLDLTAARLEAMTATALRIGDRPLGVLACFFGRRHEFGDDEQELQLTLVRMAAQALQRLRELRREVDQTRQLAERLTTTLESISDGFFTLDRDWCIAYVNHRTEAILDRSRATLLGQNFWEQFPHLEASEVGTAFHRAMSEGTTEVIEEFYFAPLEAWFAIRAYPSALGLAVFFQDTTQKRLTAEVLRQREAQLLEQAALLDETSDAIVVRDLDYRITYWNRGAEHMFGWSAEEAVGRSVVELLSPDPLAFAEAASRLLTEREWHGELVVVKKGGMGVIADCRETLLHDEAGEPIAVLGIKTDITERTRRDAQHGRSQRMESVGTLASGLAHDLNNALTPVTMATELLGNGETDQSRLAMLDTIASGTQRATAMVRQILSFVGGVEGRRISIDVGDLLRDVERIANDTFLKAISVVREESSDLMPVSGDPTQLNQVLVNLCLNARDAMADGGTLVLGAEVVTVDQGENLPNGEPQSVRYVRLRVEDDGHGMPPEVLDRIFEPFYTTKDHGTGLGLSASDGIIRSHGGFMEVDSVAGRGTRFLIHLPVAVDAAGPVPEPEAADVPGGGGELVLVVDDEEAIRTMLRIVLTRNGYRVMEAVDGADAVAVVGATGAAVDVIITDMMMPGMDGPATIRAVGKIRPKVPIILVSGIHTGTTRSDAAAMGVKHVLSKPFTTKTLLRMLREVLTQRPSEESRRLQTSP